MRKMLFAAVAGGTVSRRRDSSPRPSTPSPMATTERDRYHYDSYGRRYFEDAYGRHYVEAPPLLR